ncbi:putative isomerase [Bacillus sp. TS-2]|nr:putative isomerase [Bacillus sp. TS-2]
MLPIGLQLYTIREETAKDFIGALKKVKEIGYQGVEFAGFGDHSAAEIKEAIDDIGLKAVSSHVPLDRLENELEQVIEEQVTIGSKSVVCPFIPESYWKSKEAYEKLAEFLNTVGQRCREHGLQFGYHHHSFEFEKFGDEYALDLLLRLTDPDFVHLQCDAYWVEYAGLSAVDYIKKYEGRCKIIHMKDMQLEPEKTDIELGQGVLDVSKLVQVANDIDAEWLLVEMDHCKLPPFESIKVSFDNLEKIVKDI